MGSVLQLHGLPRGLILAAPSQLGSAPGCGARTSAPHSPSACPAPAPTGRRVSTLPPISPALGTSPTATCMLPESTACRGPASPALNPSRRGLLLFFLSIPFWMLWLTSPHQSVLSPDSSPVPLTAGAAGSATERQSVLEHPSSGFPEPSDTPQKNDTTSSRLLARICRTPVCFLDCAAPVEWKLLLGVTELRCGVLAVCSGRPLGECKAGPREQLTSDPVKQGPCDRKVQPLLMAFSLSFPTAGCSLKRINS